MGRFKFSSVSVFEDKIVETFANGDPDQEISYNEVVGFEVEVYNKWSQWGAGLGKVDAAEGRVDNQNRTSYIPD